MDNENVTYSVRLCLDGEQIGEHREWPRVPGVGESYTARALGLAAEAEFPLYTVQAVVGDGKVGWSTDWYVFLQPVTAPPAQQAQYRAVMQPAWDAGAEERAWQASVRQEWMDAEAAEAGGADGTAL
jgi:hypothetical protein